jgi:phenylalanyl-tRNA synthetase alpha chain
MPSPEEIISSVHSDLLSGLDPELVRVRVLGRKGSLTNLLRSISDMGIEEKRKKGPLFQQAKREIEAILAATVLPEDPAFDTSLPALPAQPGGLHPIYTFMEEFSQVFSDLSFDVVTGPELVTDYENFGSLNFPIDHPARDTHDTFYIDSTHQLRTHTSAVQVQEMKKRFETGQLPIRFIVPGKTYRRDSDATHSPMFHQLEGVLVDTQTTFADLKGVLDYAAKRLFGASILTRFRTHYFPFTEPSAEIDIQQVGSNHWIEWLGCGMIHPEVLRAAGINPRIYRGWAFGGGIERPVMIRHGITDLRLFFENNPQMFTQIHSS